MLLYRAEWSTNVERVTIALAHKGLRAEPRWITYDDRSPVEAVSGQGLVPVLVHDDGEAVADSMTIVADLEARFPDAPLYPPDPAGRRAVDEFVEWFNGTWKGPPNRIAEAVDRREAPDPADRDALATALDRFAEMLRDSPFLLGDGLTAADVCAYPFLKYAAGRDTADDETFHVVLEDEQPLRAGHEPLREWIARMAALPGTYASGA